MTGRLAALRRGIASMAARLPAAWRRSSTAFSDLWRRSLQVRVTVSTLALSSAVVFVLGMVLQNQITERLLETKRQAAIDQARQVVNEAASQLATSDVTSEAVADRLRNALDELTSGSASSSDSANSGAGAFQPVLAAGAPNLLPEDTPSAGPYQRVPVRLREFVQQGKIAHQIHTVSTGSGTVTYLVVGAPVTNMVRDVQLYLLFPLTSEQKTVATVQSTMLVGGLVLLVLLAAIANLVTRQVVLPVRKAASAAEQFAGGDLDKRLPVAGEDDLATLAENYNEMASNIQKQIEQLEEFGRLQRRFTQDVAHELRTPVTTVRMAADVLYASRDEFPAGLGRSAELLVNELDKLQDLLGHLLEISRLDAGVEELSSERVDLRALVEEAVRQTSGIAREEGSSLEVELPSGEVLTELDKHRILRILLNLLGNAIDHSEGRPVRVTLGADDNTVAVTVRDYGVGLNPGEVELVFNRFWRADSSRDRHTGGTGLGLAIAYEDARLHGGELDVWGAPGQGACFRLTLPRNLGSELGPSPVALPPDAPERPLLPASDDGVAAATDAPDPPPVEPADTDGESEEVT